MKLEPTNKYLDYFSNSAWQKEFSFAMLERYLKGLPNTPKARKKLKEELKIYPELDSSLVFYKGSAIPRWAIIDFYAIIRQQPWLEKKIIEEGKIEGLPTLEEVLYTPAYVTK